MCWGLGDTVCQFEGYSGPQAGYLYQENGFHPDAQRRLLTHLADQADVALDNLRLLHERREHETHDPLTGLLNFRQLREHAAFELARAKRHGRSVAFVMIDLDDFTLVNENAGREAGDEVLRHWAAALTAQLRSCDLVCRYGADEFLLLLPETADQEADAVLGRVLGAMQQLAVQPDGRAIALTACAGVASFPADGLTAEELVAKATTTMYAARSLGPGRVAFYSGPPGPERADVAARVELLVVGSLHRDLAPAARHYLELLKPHLTVTVREVKEVPLRGRSEAEVLRDEGRRLLAAWPQAPVVSALAVDGAVLDTEAFAARLQRSLERGGAGFVIGGSLGLAAEVRERATDALSLSALTLPHQLARVVLLEQLFRAGKILRGEPYHH